MRATIVLVLLAACGGGESVLGADAGADARIIERADAGACDPAATPLPNDGLEESAGEGGCAAGMVRVEAFCIDRYEAALVETSGASWSPFVNPGVTAVRAVSIHGAMPQGYISGAQAAAACAGAGKRLCTEAEWLRACQGPGGQTYPYGDSRDPAACNDERTSPPQLDYFGADPTGWDLTHRCLDQLSDTVAPAGFFAGCVSAEGVVDLVGNLNEWVDDPAGTTRGGTFVDAQVNGAGCLYHTTAHDLDYWDYSTGFRCCAD